MLSDARTNKEISEGLQAIAPIDYIVDISFEGDIINANGVKVSNIAIKDPEEIG